MDDYILNGSLQAFFRVEGGAKMKKDFICGTIIDESKSKDTYYFQGDTYYFCSSECKNKFAEATMSGINP
jgi:YHS domain-containing protein